VRPNHIFSSWSDICLPFFLCLHPNGSRASINSFAVYICRPLDPPCWFATRPFPVSIFLQSRRSPSLPKLLFNLLFPLLEYIAVFWERNFFFTCLGQSRRTASKTYNPPSRVFVLLCVFFVVSFRESSGSNTMSPPIRVPFLLPSNFHTRPLTLADGQPHNLWVPETTSGCGK